MTSRGPYRRHSTPFKLQLCQDIRDGIIGRRDAQRSHDISASLIHLWQLRRPVETAQYASRTYRDALKAAGLRGSVSSVGNP